jgi:minor extracellular serine protease Vpr
MFRITLGALAGALAIALAWGGGTRLAAQDVAVGNTTGAYFVELNAPVDTFRAQARAAGIDFSERYVYSRLWRGLSVNAASDAIALIARLPSVGAVFPVLTMRVGPTGQATPDLAHALAMTGADVAQSNGWTGAGVKVGVIDTGVDYDHPDLGGGFGPGHRVATGYDFVGDRFDASGSGGALILHPDPYPDDCNSHGTHVAGIIGASGNPATGGARGVAPAVTFGAYRVFGCDGATTGDIMIAAMERALADGMQVVNISIGAAFVTWPQYPTAVAADALVDAGVIVMTSIGNSGANGLYSASAPGVGRKVIGVASFDNSHVNVASFIANPGGTVMGYTPLSGPAGDPGPPAPPTSGTSPEIVYVGRGCLDNDLATAGNQTDPYLVNPAGKVALIVRGVCSFNEKYARAADAGAAGVIIQNNAPGIFFGGFTVGKGIFGIGISQADGNTLQALPSPTATWTADTIDVANPTAGRASAFSSYGLDAELGLKPDIGAPGGLIRSTIPLEMGAYGILSGTSMASPHVAGAAALLLQAKPGTSPALARRILQNSADPVLFGTTPTTLLEVVHRQGAGMLDIDDAIAADSLVSPGKISLGEGTGGTATLSITNNSVVDRIYALAHQRAVSTFGSTFAPSATTAGATAVFSHAGATVTSVTVAAGATETVDVTFTTPALLNGLVYGGYLRVTGGGADYRVPYAGFWGDYQLIQVLAPGGCNFPGIFKSGGQTVCTAATPTTPAAVLADYTRQNDAATFNVEDRDDRPILLFHLAHQSQRLEIRAINELTHQSYLVAYADYLSRSPTNGLNEASGAFASYRWDGKKGFTNTTDRTRRNEVPAGLYRLQAVVTKALAEPGNPAHIETYTSPLMNIVRH